MWSSLEIIRRPFWVKRLHRRPRALSAFRALHPGGWNYVLSPQVGSAYVRDAGSLEVVFCNLE